MKLDFSEYNPDLQLLTFTVSICNPEDANYRKEVDARIWLGDALSAKLKFLSGDAALKIYKTIPGLCQFSDDIESFLTETKKCFLDAGITLDNWKSFIASIESATSLKLTPEVGYTPTLLSTLPNDVTQLIATLLKAREHAVFLRTSTSLLNKTDDYRTMLKTYFPTDYAKVNWTNSEAARLSVEIKDPHHAKKSLMEYKKAFGAACKRLYAGLTPRQVKLLMLFKAGDLEAIKQAEVTVEELWEVKDNQYRCLMLWAVHNHHQYVLDYCYNKIVLPYYKTTEHGLDVLKVGFADTTILHCAVMCLQSVEILSLLLQSGASVNAQTGSGMNAFLFASQAAHIAGLKLFLSLPDVDVKKTTNNGTSALYLASMDGHADVIDLLLAAPGVEVNRTNDNNRSAAYVAASNGHRDCLRKLLAIPGIDINKATNENITPLMDASCHGHHACVEVLLKVADINVHTKSSVNGNLTALGYAALNGHSAIVALLVAHPQTLSGFYEWLTVDSAKQPFYFKNQDGSLLAIAAIWEQYTNDKNETISTCCLVTTNANDIMMPIHDRMPVILNDEQQTIWLNNNDFNKDTLSQLLTPRPTDLLIKHPVTPKMNNSRYEANDAISPIVI